MIRILTCVFLAIFLPMPFAITTNGEASSPSSEKITDQELNDFAKKCGVAVGEKDDQILGRFAKRAINIAKTWDDVDSLAVDSDTALGRMVNLASWHLKRAGENKASKLIVDEYRANFDGYFASKITAKGIGDHAPLSQWLAKWYDKLEAKFGKRFMEITRLKDLKTFNYGIPVVFSPRGESREEPLIPWDRQDYVDHFVPFAGAVSYWAAWGACTAGTWGLGWVTFVCSYAGWAAEYVVMNEIAPGLGAKIWDRYNIPETAWRKALKAIGL